MSNIEEIKKKIDKDLFFLAKHILGFKDICQETHGDTVRLLESIGTRKLICLPRGCLKSSLACVAYPIWLLLKNPNLRILIDSELYTNSSNFIREIKAHLKNRIITYLYGDLEGDVWSQSEITVSTRNKTFKEASLTASGIGAEKTGQHYDVIICDDLNSPKNTNTPENADKVIDHFRYNISILEPRGTYVVIGTRYASNDVIGFILQNEANDFKESA